MSDRPDKPQLRQQARRRRRSLDPAERPRMQADVAGHLLAAAKRQRWQRIGAYAATASELDLAPFFNAAAGLDPPASIYLPAILAPGVMVFRRWPIGSGLVEGPHRILQPSAHCRESPASALDAILLPLLAFDHCGTRLGSGAGYYDRLLAFRRQVSTPPRLVGIAFQAQHMDALPRDAWDIPLDAVCTETGWRDLRAGD
ncbi:MAG: 5-formyltetrahydrofolate cyclo-ligase [Xanthomonadales bacterium]|nr:5-formyltetrahydrofolate cyclo-ligase [Xanthomonadales bacterium]